MKPKYRIKFYSSSVAGRWFSQCYFIGHGKEILIRGSTEPYGIIGPNNSIVWVDNKDGYINYLISQYFRRHDRD